MSGNDFRVMALVIATFGCGGEVQSLGDARGGAAGSSGASNVVGSGGSPAVQSNLASCETECFRAIVNAVGTGCKICHGKLVKLSGTLDLESAGVSARFKDAPAEHAGINVYGVCPQGDKLIDSANPQNSWLLKKVTNLQGSCGTVMPSTGALSATDQQCMVAYVNCVASR